MSNVASLLRGPIMADQATTNKSKINFASILVEIDIAKPMLEVVEFINEKDELVE